MGEVLLYSSKFSASCTNTVINVLQSSNFTDDIGEQKSRCIVKPEDAAMDESEFVKSSKLAFVAPIYGGTYQVLVLVNF